jgi:apolipoprotein N-acyltransferase
MLAVAEGLPLVRAANDGISAVIDPVGRVIRALPLGAEGVLDAPLPRALAPTVYVRVGNFAVIILMVVAGIFVVRRRLRT